MSIEKQMWTLLAPQGNLVQGSVVTLSQEELHYAFHVLRLKQNDPVCLTDCCGTQAHGTIEEISKKKGTVKVQTCQTNSQKKPLINLWLGMPKPSTLEEVVAVASELGVHEIHVFKTEKCAFKSDLKKEKLQRLSDEAVRISKSAFSAKIVEQPNLQRLLQTQSGSVVLFCDEAHVYDNKIQNSIFNALSSIDPTDIHTISLLVGPEASFSAAERQLILQHPSVVSVSLGSHILRVATAVVVGIGCVQNHNFFPKKSHAV